MSELEAGGVVEEVDTAAAVDPAKAADTATTETVETKTTETTDAADTTKADDVKKDVTSDWPDDWREKLAGEDEGAMKLLKRYGSLKGVIKKLVEQDKLISSGKFKRDMPDPSDEKAIAEWRKEQGVPDDPSGYKLPETVTKRLTDDDKPVLASFTEFAHSKGAPPAVVEIASEWYINQLETMEAARIQADTSAAEAAEDALRKDWAHGEFKSNLTLAKRFAAEIPGVGAAWSEARLPDGRRIGDIPEFVAWAADMGRDKFGDVTFANSDSEARHTNRRAEIEKIRDTDFNRYEAENLDKELRVLIEKDLARGKR